MIYVNQKSKLLFYIYILGLNPEGCTSDNPCGDDEGDCDYDYQCRDNHKCGNNNCRSLLGLESYYDCCYGVEEDFCTTNNPCYKDEGDCDSHEVCQDNLLCGLNNCPDSLGHSDFDCCYLPAVGDEYFCSTNNLCEVDEGDCESHDECQAGLACGSDNCLASLGFASEIDCCYETTLEDCCDSCSPFEGTEVSWSDKQYGIGIDTHITGLEVRAGFAIAAIRVKYGKNWGQWHGKSGGSLNSFELNYNETIIKVQGTSGILEYYDYSIIQSIEFITNHGRKFGPYGGLAPWTALRSMIISWSSSTYSKSALAWIDGDVNDGDPIKSLSFNYNCIGNTSNYFFISKIFFQNLLVDYLSNSATI